jgi:hypothetical protein
MRAILGCSLLWAPLLAQAPAWNLPPGGLATYEKKETFGQQGAVPERPGNWIPDEQLPHSSLLLESELDDDRRHLRLPPATLRWLVPWLAFDLRSFHGGKVSVTVPMVPNFGDLQFDGSATAPTAEGKQTLTLRCSKKPFTPRAGAPKGAAERWRPMFDADATGTLVLTRRFDSKQGVIAAFHGDLQLATHLGVRWQNSAPNLHCEQTWTLAEVKPRRGPDFRVRVADAIKKGGAHLKRHLDLNRPELATSGKPSTGEGRLALMLLTLMAAGESPRDPALVAAFAELRRREIRATYSLSLASLAVERSYAPVNERDDLLSGRLKKPAPRTPSDEDRKLLDDWATRLLGNRDNSVDNAYLSRWWYEGGAGFDNSNTQYALLGLYSVQLCGGKVSRGVWFAAAEHWLKSQHPADEDARLLRLTPTTEVENQDPQKARTSVAGRKVEPRGWSYTLPGTGDAYGSMTCAGIASLSLCASAVDDGKARTPLQGRIDDAIRSGLAWLSRNHSVRGNPGPPDHLEGWYYYWMYSLERACELSRVGLIDGWDWYHDGAQVLLDLQHNDGHFPGTLEDTCFAVLFLKKAQLPVFTGPR